jgi:hypothetical protein
MDHIDRNSLSSVSRVDEDLGISGILDMVSE